MQCSSLNTFGALFWMLILAGEEIVGLSGVCWQGFALRPRNGCAVCVLEQRSGGIG